MVSKVSHVDFKSDCNCAFCKPSPEDLREIVRLWGGVLRDSFGVPDEGIPAAACRLNAFMAAQHQAIQSAIADWIEHHMRMSVDAMRAELPEAIAKASLDGMLAMVERIRDGEPVRWKQEQLVEELARQELAKKVGN